MKYGHPESPEAKEAELERQRAGRAIERREWRQYQRLYERCKAIAEAVWSDDLEKAAAQQQTLAEQMRDRWVQMQKVDAKTGALIADNEIVPLQIPVPLFTPRDRMQFIKEATANLMIGTERRGLRAEFSDKDELNGEQTEAASGVDEGEAQDVGLAPSGVVTI